MGRASVERAQDAYQMTHRSPNRDVSAIRGFVKLEALTDTRLGGKADDIPATWIRYASAPVWLADGAHQRKCSSSSGANV